MITQYLCWKVYFLIKIVTKIISKQFKNFFLFKSDIANSVKSFPFIFTYWLEEQTDLFALISLKSKLNRTNFNSRKWIEIKKTTYDEKQTGDTNNIEEKENHNQCLLEYKEYMSLICLRKKISFKDVNFNLGNSIAMNVTGSCI